MSAYRNLFGTVAVAAAMTLAGPAAIADDRSDWPDSVTVGTASQGGTYFVYGAGWAGLVQEETGLATSSEVTGGPVQNMALVHQGDLDFGMVTMGPAFEGWTGESELAPGVEMRNVRAMFPMYMTPFQVVTLAGSGIEGIADLEGQRLGVGPRGGTPGTYWPRFVEALGVDARISYGGAADLAGQLQDGLIDAFAFAAGLPISAFSQVEAQTDARMFAFTQDEQDALLEMYPSVAPFTIPAGTYQSQDADQHTVAMWNFAIANADMPETLVYEIMKTVLDNHDRMMDIHNAAADTKPEHWDKNGFLWFHPGALRYFEEQGYDIPEELRPPEMR